MLATLSKKTFSRENWIFERKLDGERCLAFKRGSKVRLMSRNKKDISAQYPEIVGVLENQKGNCILDGEIVAFDGEVTSFSKLQSRMHSEDPDKNIDVFYYVFDVLYLDGYDLSKLPLDRRKSVLKESIDFDNNILRFTPHRNTDGEEYLQEACEKGWEGLIAKDAHSVYRHSRSKKWLKFKCEKGQELVICGYTPPEGSRKHFGALIVGFYDDGELKEAGKVGSGYDQQTLKILHEKMKKIERKSSPFGDEVNYKDATWLQPELVGEFRFTEWTEDGKLRHPSFLGLREDKKPEDVKKEEA